MRKHLLSLYDFQCRELQDMLKETSYFLNAVESNSLARTLHEAAVATVCWPAFTARRAGHPVLVSFQSAAEQLGALTFTVSPPSSEAAVDMITASKRLFQSTGRSKAALVVSHSKAGVTHQIASRFSLPNDEFAVINAGDGGNESPTEGLLYLALLFSRFGRSDGLRVLLIGDFTFDPLARSIMFGLSRTKAEINLLAPPTLLPREFPADISFRTYFRSSAVDFSPDVVLVLPVSKRALNEGLLPSEKEYCSLFSLEEIVVRLNTSQAMILHPPHVTDNSFSLVPEAPCSFSHRLRSPNSVERVTSQMAILTSCLLN